jgi:ribosome-associated protein
MKLKKSESLALVKLCCRALEEKKVEDLRVMDVSEQSSITDFLILATGTSSPHLRALRIEVEKALDAAKARIVGMEIPQDGGWMVIDAFDVMVHLFTADQRERYALENLWKDATEISVAKLLAMPKPKKSVPVKKAALKKLTNKVAPKRKAQSRKVSSVAE